MRYFRILGEKILLSIFYALFYLRVSIRNISRSLSSFVKIAENQHDKASADFKTAIFRWEISHEIIKSRINFMILGFLLVFITLIVRLLIVASNDYIEMRKSIERTTIHRYDITDRNGNLLAVNVPSASLFANPYKVVDPKEAVAKLMTVMPNLNAQKLLSELQSNKTFIWIKRDITPTEHEKIYNLGMPGFGFEREQKRLYTYGNLLAHVVGYVGRDMKGLSGVEQFFDQFLSNSQGAAATANKMHKNTLQLSIDVRMQNILSEEIDKTVARFHAKGAAGLIVDPNNGEILALVSKPDFDPHNPGSSSPDQLFNMATQGVYEMGSGMKSLTLAIGMDTGVTSIYDVYDISYMRVNGFQVKDYYPMKGWHSVPHIFLKSSNIGVSQIMLEIGKQHLLEYLRKLKLLEPLNIEINERARPLFPNYVRWNDLSLTTMAYGYGISESSAHFVQAMVPVVNGGLFYPLTLIKRKPESKFTPERVFKEETSSNMRKLMRLVVSEGTGSKAEVVGYYVGGKTGTANIAQGGRYDPNKRVSSFFGIMPASKPKYMIYIVINQPVGIKESYGFAGGGWTAAPTVGAVFKRLITLYGINELDPDSAEVRELTDIEYKIKDDT